MIFSGPIQIIVNAVDKAIGVNGAKRLALMIVSGFFTALCFMLIRYWTYVPSYSQVIHVGHQFSADTSSTHVVTADVDIMMYDGYVMSDNKDQPYLLTRSCVFHYGNSPKDSLIKRPEKSSVESINQYYSFPLTSETGGKNSVPISHAANVGVFCHSFNTGAEWQVVQSPLMLDSLVSQDPQGGEHMVYTVHCFDDNDALNIRDYQYLSQRLPNIIWDKESGRMIHSYACVLTDSAKRVASIGHQVNKIEDSCWKRLCYHVREFIKLYDISRCNYFVFFTSSGIDTVNVRFSFFENVDIVSSAQEIGKDYVKYSMPGDQVSAKGVTFITGSARLLESENTQLVRLFAVTTFCAIFFGYFLKYLVKILLSIKFHRKNS